ncbi:MAG: TIGR02996 domain-containing protein, partial [Myxococcota bacterium]
MQPIHVIARRLLRAPHDEEAWLVFADWLLDRGDPRGEWLVLHHQLSEPSLRGRQRLAIERRLREAGPPTEEELLEELDLHGMWWVINVNARRGFILGLTLAWMRELTLECLERVAAHPAGTLWSALSVSGLGSADTARLVHTDALADRAVLDIAQPRAYKARIGAAGAHTLASASRLRHLEVLRVGGNDIGSEGAVALVQSPHLADLRVLDLGANGLDDAGFERVTSQAGLAR